MITWSICIAAIAWTALCIAAIALICRSWRSLTKVDAGMEEGRRLIEQLRELTRRAEKMLNQAEQTGDTIKEWSDTLHELHKRVGRWNKALGRWSQRAYSGIGTAREADERREPDTQLWLDILFKLWSEIRSRRARAS
ncbi:hypothetical protein M3650_17800 [Paenibacillus sp. MER TA 81-3]|uniref:hypothetical protein n=1 Tax=Paenibacillus sp. MER TA 81-3 TaxID=2939573 RepID=UPI00203A6CA4|nr:hypothetical protein [Paenibacillus sp. MER TA 81-3]MCM3340444.1 hypothetical protein [Paenibacillus sp. MER TA 81-3]